MHATTGATHEIGIRIVPRRGCPEPSVWGAVFLKHKMPNVVQNGLKACPIAPDSETSPECSPRCLYQGNPLAPRMSHTPPRERREVCNASLEESLDISEFRKSLYAPAATYFYDLIYQILYFYWLCALGSCRICCRSIMLAGKNC